MRPAPSLLHELSRCVFSSSVTRHCHELSSTSSGFQSSQAQSLGTAVCVGLDSTTAMHLLSTLRDLAKGGRAIVTTIHQPSSRLFQQLDKLLLLSKVGMATVICVVAG